VVYVNHYQKYFPEQSGNQMTTTLVHPPDEKQPTKTTAVPILKPLRLETPAQRLAKRPLTTPQMRKLRDVEVVVIEDRCKGCSFCIEFCPRDVLEQSPKLNIRGAHVPRVKDATLCVGCGICEEICPDFAIFLVEKGEKR